MNEIECICVILNKNSNPEKGRLKFLNFYSRGLLVEIIEEFRKTPQKKILIKNDFNCFFPEKFLFYYMRDNEFNREVINNDMQKLKIKKYVIFK